MAARCGPGEGASISRADWLWGGKQSHRVPTEDWLTAAQHTFGEKGDIAGGGKQPGVRGDAAHHGSIFVVDLALDDAMAEIAIALGRWDQIAQLSRRAITGARHAEWAENFPTSKGVERLA